jgi:teichuronic acid biosynthesis glycosyltransferase TuaC
MLHALQFSQQFPSERYPALGVMVQNAVRALAEQIDVSVLAPRPYTLPIAGFPYGGLARLPMRRREGAYDVHRPRYLYLVPKPLFYPWAGPAMAQAVLRYAAHLPKPDLIHAHWSYPDGWAARALRDHFGCPLIVHARGTLERVIALQSPRFRNLISTPLRAADAVIANSDALRADCLALGVAEDKIHVIPNGVDLSLFTPADKSERKRSLGFDPARMLLLYCGNLREVKGVDLLAEALPALCAERPNLDVAIVGAGELDGALRSALAQLLQSRRVRMTGALPQAQVASYMQAADLLVLPSRSEARGNVILEALACQTPVAAARVGGIPEVVFPEHGVLFEPASTPAIVQALTLLTGDPARLLQLGAAGRRFVLESGSSWQAHAARTKELYEATLGSKSRV